MKISRDGHRTDIRQAEPGLCGYRIFASLLTPAAKGHSRRMFFTLPADVNLKP
jgi:hypothetical protein